MSVVCTLHGLAHASHVTNKALRETQAQVLWRIDRLYQMSQTEHLMPLFVTETDGPSSKEAKARRGGTSPPGGSDSKAFQ